MVFAYFIIDNAEEENFYFSFYTLKMLKAFSFKTATPLIFKANFLSFNLSYSSRK
jgi:hypothetical protein